MSTKLSTLPSRLPERLRNGALRQQQAAELRASRSAGMTPGSCLVMSISIGSSRRDFVSVLEAEYMLPETADMLWESIYLDHVKELDMRIRKYPAGIINEFDSIDELRDFDPAFMENIDSDILAGLVMGGAEGGWVDCADADCGSSARHERDGCCPNSRGREGTRVMLSHALTSWNALAVRLDVFAAGSPTSRCSMDRACGLGVSRCLRLRMPMIAAFAL